jgi:hypothetical protein
MEAVVGVAIFSVITGILATFSIDMIKTGSATNNRLTNVDQLRVAMDDVSKGLRIAVRPEQINGSCTAVAPVGCDVSLYVPAPESVRFYANHGDAAGPRLTTYQVQADPDHPGTGRLVATLGRPGTPVALNSATCGTGCVTRVLARNLVWPVTSPVFTYAGSGCSAFAAPPVLLPAAVAADTACVSIRLEAAGARDNDGASVTSAVFLPNSVIGR